MSWPCEDKKWEGTREAPPQNSASVHLRHYTVVSVLPLAVLWRTPEFHLRRPFTLYLSFRQNIHARLVAAQLLDYRLSLKMFDDLRGGIMVRTDPELAGSKDVGKVVDFTINADSTVWVCR